jgi:hypothetical protein
MHRSGCKTPSEVMKFDVKANDKTKKSQDNAKRID